MNPRSAAVVALLAAGFVYQPETSAPPSRAKERSLAPPAGASTIVYDKELPVEDWPREKMHEFFTTRQAAQEEAKRDICPFPGATKVDFLIATVPDPQNSHYPVMFDRFVESIRRASEDRDYELDRFWLPWDADPGPPDSDWLKRVHHEDWQRRKQDYPGILVFRYEPPVPKSDRAAPDAQKKTPTKVLGVLLVGENPLTGIDKQQFAHALSLIRHFTGPPKQVQIMGPTFSGSIHSLGIAILDACGHTAGATDYHVISGSATGARNKEALQRSNAEHHADHPDCPPGQPRITYSAAIENDLVAFDRFFSYLDPDFHADAPKPGWYRRHDVELNRVAILAEAGSGYASQLLDEARNKQLHSPKTNDPQGEKSSKAETGPSKTQDNYSSDRRYLILQYPMEISRLRNAYEDDPELSALTSNAAGQMPHQGLQIRLKDAHDSEDSVPSFSGELTPASKEAALLNTISIISRERIEYVGIVASDILDAIFLGRLLKQHCPDVRLFIFDSDLIYGHLAQNYAFQGMIMVTSYPLFDANQRWTNSWGGNRRRRQFASATAQGVYNASLMLLNELADAPDQRTPLLEYGPPVEQEKPVPGRPALWLTVVGRDGIWPLAPLDLSGLEPAATEESQNQNEKELKLSRSPNVMLSAKVWKEDGSKKEPVGKDDTPKDKANAGSAGAIGLPLLDDPSRGWVLGFWLMTLFCGLLAWALYISNRAPSDGKTVRRGRLAILWVGSDDYSLGLRLCISMAVGVLMLAYGLVAATEISYLHWFIKAGPQSATLANWWDWLATWNGWFRLAEASACVVTPMLLAAAAAWCWGLSKRTWLFVQVFCVATAVLCFALFYRYPLSLYFVYRLVHINNGVSPIVPAVLLCMGLLWYAYSHLNRVRLCRSRPAGLPSFEGDIYLDGVDGLSQTGGLEQAHTRMTQALEQWWLGPGSKAALISLIASLLLLEPWRIASIERFPFEWPYTLGLCVLYAGMLFACARFLHAWFDLRRILRMLERHPMREAFKRLPKEVSPSAIWRWGGGRQTYLTLAHSIDRLRALAERRQNKRFDHQHDFDYDSQLSLLEQGAQQLMVADSSVQSIGGDSIACVHAVLIRVSNHMVRNVLMPHWQKGLAGEVEPQPVAVAAAVASSGTSLTIQQPPVSPSDVGLAEEFVALRFVALIRYLTLQLKNLLEFAAGGLILAVVSLNSYPFEPHHSIITVISICFFALGAVFLTAFAQMNRNTIVSYLNDSTPGKLDGDILHVLSIGALPLLTILGSQFPSLGGFLFSWIKPALETLR